MTDPVTAYARRVVSGKVPCGTLHRLACQRHLADLKDGRSRGLRWSPADADRAIRFFSKLRHYKGEWAGRPFALQDWQQFIIGSIFGWKREDGLRRFRTAYIELPRKNGKSTLAAGIALWLAFFDGEPGAECYVAATKRDQARIVFDACAQMVKATAALSKRIGKQAGNLHQLATASKLEPLGADADTLDGLNPNGVVIDELHAHKSSAVVDVMQTATGSRRQPLQTEITTAGMGRENICWKHHEYSAQIVEGVLQDDSWFSFICAADSEDDWTDPATWAKANPNLGISVKRDDLERKCAQAIHMPAAQNAFRRLHLNQWTEQAERFLDMAAWDKPQMAAPIDEDALRGVPCYAGLDLSTRTDLTAFVLVFPMPDGTYTVLPHFWVPEENIRQRALQDHVPYDVWVREGVMHATPGNVVDHAFVRKDIEELGERFPIQMIGYDPWNADEMANRLTDLGFQVVTMRQGHKTLTEPTQKLAALVAEGKLHHGGHPVLRWNAANLVVRLDPAGNPAPDKGKATERIDGMVALIMGLGLTLARKDAPVPMVSLL